MKNIEQIKKELVEFYDKNNRLPTKKDFPNYQRTIRKECERWNLLIIELFGKVNTNFNNTKKDAVEELLKYYKEHNEIPKSNYNYGMTQRVQTAFGTWNNGIEAVFGKVNQHRYKENIVDSVKEYIIKYKRLPLREEFNGKEFPFFGAILKQLNCSKWSEIFKYIDLTNVVYYNDKNHGTGKVYIDENGIVYLSRQEFLIGKWLRENNIVFEKEVKYENSNHVFDFFLPEYKVYIEYYGLSDNKEYKKRIEEKRNLYNGRKVIEIMKHDNTIKKLSQEVQRL